MKLLEIEIFVIDDDPHMTDAIGAILTTSGRTNFRLFNSTQELLDNLTDNVHICIVDFMLGRGQMNGLELIKKIVLINEHCWFIMLSGQDDKKVIIDFMNSVYGSRYIEKCGDIMSDLLFAINDIEKHIHFIDRFYHTAKRQLECLNDLKNLLKRDVPTE